MILNQLVNDKFFIQNNFGQNENLNKNKTILIPGSTSSGFGGYIGIPINYLYETTNDVDKVNLKMGRESINWNSQYGQLLEKSLVLTEDEKEFGLLKAAFELRNNNYIHRSLIPFGSICALYFLSQKVNQHMDLYQKPRTVCSMFMLELREFIFHVLVCLFCRSDYLFTPFLAQLYMECIRFSLMVFEFVRIPRSTNR